MSEYIEVTEPVALDSTLQTLVSAVQDLSEAVAPTNVYVDIAATLSVGGWSNATPSVYTLTDSKITGTCEIEVFFAPGAESNPTPYVEFEKGVGSVIFYAPSKPTMDLPVIVRVINAEASIASNIDATMVSTNAISGASNVQQALGSVNSSIGALNNKLAPAIKSVFRMANTAQSLTLGPNTITLPETPDVTNSNFVCNILVKGTPTETWTNGCVVLSSGTESKDSISLYAMSAQVYGITIISLVKVE